MTVLKSSADKRSCDKPFVRNFSSSLRQFKIVEEFIRYLIDHKCFRQSADDKKAPRVSVAIYSWSQSGSTTVSVL